MYTIHHDVQINALPELVFDAIANPQKMVHWWPLRCNGELKLGGIYNLFFTPEYDWYGEVVKFDRNESFHIRMTQSDEDWDPTTFGYDLVLIDEGTRVSFFHKGWMNCNQHFRRSSYCWAILLKGLKEYVEQGLIVPFEHRA